MSRFAPDSRITRVALITSLLLLGAVCRADSGYSTYTFGNLFVFDTQGTDGARTLNVVSLDDGSSLRVIGRTKMPGQSSYVGAYGNCKDKLLVLLWDRLEVYDLSNPTRPAFLRTFALKNQGFSSPGYPRIVPAEGSRFVILDTNSTSELQARGEVSDWQVVPTAVPPELKAKMDKRPPVADFDTHVHESLLVKETDKFRYELVWKNQNRPGLITHREYLRKVEKTSSRVLATLPLGIVEETID